MFWTRMPKTAIDKYCNFTIHKYEIWIALHLLRSNAPPFNTLAD